MSNPPKAVLTKYSHHFTVTQMATDSIRRLVHTFYDTFAKWGDGKRADGTRGQVIECHFAVRMDDGETYRFHINAWNQFSAQLNQMGHFKEEFEIVTAEPPPEGQPAELSIGSPHIPTQQQEDNHQYLLQDTPVSKLILAQTGTGKTDTACRYLAVRQKRIMLIIRPMYIEKWVSDIHTLCSVPLDRIAVVSSDKDHAGVPAKLRGLLDYEPDELPYDAIIMSNKSLRVYLMEYIAMGAEILNYGYPCTPVEMFARLGVDNFMVDERHQDFHLNFLIDLFTHIRSSASMTATYMSQDRFIARMQAILHPPHSRAKEVEYRVYSRVTSFHYWFKQPKHIRLSHRGSNNYSHTAYEDSIMTHPELRLRYFDMVRVAVERYWNGPNKKPGDRCLVFFATKNMCGAFTTYLRKFYPGVAINRYVEDDPYSNLIESDIAVSTVLSAGTAHDIKQLTAAVMTIALSALHTNWQVLGRLRDLRDGRNPYFVYFVCEDFNKHLDYHDSKRVAFQEKRIPMYSYAYGTPI